MPFIVSFFFFFVGVVGNVDAFAFLVDLVVSWCCPLFLVAVMAVVVWVVLLGVSVASSVAFGVVVVSVGSGSSVVTYKSKGDEGEWNDDDIFL